MQRRERCRGVGEEPGQVLAPIQQVNAVYQRAEGWLQPARGLLPLPHRRDRHAHGLARPLAGELQPLPEHQLADIGRRTRGEVKK